jgi:hypothetical protein
MPAEQEIVFRERGYEAQTETRQLTTGHFNDSIPLQGKPRWGDVTRTAKGDDKRINTLLIIRCTSL